MYCLKCKKHTDTQNIQHAKTSNNRMRKKGICIVCGTKKSQFVGSGIVNNLINKLPFEMHLPGHNFTGPGTKLEKRLQADGTPHSWSKPINRIDNAAMNHDICYSKNKDTTTRNKVCDQNMLQQLKGIYNPSVREKMERSIVSTIIGSKQKFGLGLKKKK